MNVGDRVAAGQVVARLDPQTEQNALSAAKAGLEAARGEVNTARSTFERQEQLMAQGFTTRPRFDQALQAQETAQARLENAEAQVELAQDRLGFTELRADVAGVVTARSVEPGEVVQPGQVVVQVARDDGRDAVFNVPARLLETQTGGAIDPRRSRRRPAVVAYGRVREVAPQADPVTRTFQVRVGLQDPPEAMRLGSTVTGTMELTSTVIVAIPASALTQSGRSPAVWIVDPDTRPFPCALWTSCASILDRVILSQGLEPGETIVSGGIQALHPGQRVVMLPPRGGRPHRAARTAVVSENAVAPLGRAQQPANPGRSRNRPAVQSRCSPMIGERSSRRRCMHTAFLHFNLELQS